MKLFNLIALAVLAAAPSLAIEVDCAGSSSTTYELTRLEPPGCENDAPATCTRIDIIYRFYDGSSLESKFNMVEAGTDPDAFAAGRCEFADQEALDRALGAATGAVCTKPLNPELIIPAFPEVPNTDPNAPTVAEARQRSWHRVLLRELWPQPTMTFTNCVLDLWQWVNTQQNTPGRRAWWENGVSQDGECNSRFGGLAGAESILLQDEQYLNTNLDSF